MCGRYYVDDETAKEIEKIIRQVNDKLIIEKKARDIYPSAKAPVILNQAEELVARDYSWGFPNFAKTSKSSVIFNARSETALDKRVFKESVLTRRCIIPATGFYEWNQNKDKYFFRSPDQKVLLFAGFYNCFQGEERFVILTTDANSSVEEVHHRMPLILEISEVESWIYDEKGMEAILHKTPKPLSKEIQGQLSFEGLMNR